MNTLYHSQVENSPVFKTRKFAACTDAVSFTLAACGLPEKFRAFVDALIGASAGIVDDWFEASDEDVGLRARDQAGISRAALTKWTQRQREALIDWQRESGLTLIESMPGGQDSRKQRHKTRYRLPVMELVVKVDAKARASRYWQGNRKKAFYKAAAEVFRVEKNGLIGVPKRERFKRPGRSAESFEKAAITNLNRAIGLAMMQQNGISEACRMLREVKEYCDAAMSKMSENTDIFNLEVVKTNGLDELTVDTGVHHTSGDVQAAGEQFVLKEKQRHMDKTASAFEVSMDDEREHAAADDRSDYLQLDVAPKESEALLTPAARVLSADGLDMTDGQRAVDAFRSVGVLTVKVFSNEHGSAHTVDVPVQVLQADIHKRTAAAERQGADIVTVRPLPVADAVHVQVDDPTKRLDELTALAFLTVATSPGKTQSWLAVELVEGGPAAADIRRAVIKYFGADHQASGSMRAPGSHNRKYEPSPIVRTAAVQRGLVHHPDALKHILTVETEQAKPSRPRSSAGKRRPEIPSWDRVAALHPDKSPSQIDWSCMLAAAENGVEFDEAVQWLSSNSRDIEQRKKPGHLQNYVTKTVSGAYAEKGR